MHHVLVHTWLIQFCPTPVRDERINVGLIAIGSQSRTLRLRIDPNGGERVAAIWRQPLLRDLATGQCGALVARLQDICELAGNDVGALRAGVERVGARLANELVLVGSRDRLMPDTEAAFDALYDEAVGLPQA
jgi:hypothetical protein